MRGDGRTQDSRRSLARVVARRCRRDSRSTAGRSRRSPHAAHRRDDLADASSATVGLAVVDSGNRRFAARGVRGKGAEQRDWRDRRSGGACGRSFARGRRTQSGHGRSWVLHLQARAARGGHGERGPVAISSSERVISRTPLVRIRWSSTASTTAAPTPERRSSARVGDWTSRRQRRSPRPVRARSSRDRADIASQLHAVSTARTSRRSASTAYLCAGRCAGRSSAARWETPSSSRRRVVWRRRGTLTGAASPSRT